MRFNLAHFSFLFFSFEIETTNTFIHSRCFLENHTQFQTRKGNMYLFSDRKGAKTTPFGATYLKEYVLKSSGYKQETC